MKAHQLDPFRKEALRGPHQNRLSCGLLNHRSHMMKAKILGAALMITAAIPSAAIAGVAPAFSGNVDLSNHFSICSADFNPGEANWYYRYPCWALS
jgi:hypothetical protein